MFFNSPVFAGIVNKNNFRFCREQHQTRNPAMDLEREKQGSEFYHSGGRFGRAYLEAEADRFTSSKGLLLRVYSALLRIS